MNSRPRIMLAGTNSGCGKTTIVNALLYALKKRGLPICGFKCGPDYIDPMFHTKAIGIPSYNLDLFFMDKYQCLEILKNNIKSNGFGIIEGVMGFYDGISGTSSDASSSQLALYTDTPSVLVVRPKGQSLSVGALLHGFKTFEKNNIKGIIFNDISQGMYNTYKIIAENIGLKVYGYMPKVKDAEIPSRHLGLVTANELDDLKHKLDLLSDIAEKTIDIDGLLKLCKTASDIDIKAQNKKVQPFINIAVAKDNAFCFYYQDNLDLLEQNGFNIVYFSPLSDSELPKNISGLYIGGGYPELYLDILSKNKFMLSSIKNAFESGMPLIAECGGFMYLHSSIKDKNGKEYNMCNIINGCCEMTDKLQNFGYINITSNKDCLIANKGESIRSHEFHYSYSNSSGADFKAVKPNGKAWDCVHSAENLYAGYPHLYFRNNKTIITNFLKACKRFGGII